MSRNIVPRVNKGADLGTSEKNWNRLFADAVILRGSDLKALLDGKTDLGTLTAKGDLYVATDAGVITRLPAGEDGYVLKTDSGDPKGLMWGPAGVRQELTSDMTVTVGSGGDFPTINAALENIVSLYYPKYIANGNCPRVTINLLSGFVMAEQVLVTGIDLSWITITGVDAETMITRSALTRYFVGQYPAFGAHRGTLPVIGQLFNMDATGTATGRDGVFCNFGRCNINSACGVKNAGSNGIYANRSSTINAEGANASGAVDRGIYANRSSTINANGANASGAGVYGIISSDGSTINAEGANASGAGGYGIFSSDGSTINANGANASGAGGYGIISSNGSTINANGANASGAVTYGIFINFGGIINAKSATGTLNPAANTLTSRGIIFQ